MPKCKLCCDFEATKLNSHIITWALIKDMVNQPGFKERGHDVTFAIPTYSDPSLFVGRSVLPKHIEKVTKRSIEDEVISSNDPFSRDNILCPLCETKISSLENEFINKVYSKIVRAGQTLIDKKGNYYCQLSEYETKLTYLFAYSIFFRCSIARFNNYSVSEKIEEGLRRSLIDILNVDSKVLKKNINDLNSDLFVYPIVFCYLDTDKDDISANLVIQNHSCIPYFIWANRTVFELFEKKTHVKASIEYFYGLSGLMDLKEYFNSDSSSRMNVCIISNDNRKQMVLKTVEGLAELNMNNMKVLFNDVCKKLLHRNASENEKNKFAYYYSRFYADKFHNEINEPVIKAILATFNVKDDRTTGN